ncbi:hypothetical protein PHYSODRAFT_346022 [Phytophthora sojae]|uniref:Uncharacterized protein n=1 Tax=Phytophthora sojae (strain P6497) TaxID=1094619 RepID=G4ZIF7_PHYSP|nr:hypothetical protein PHYSODRAFT_346022 [Phytophthora sojae]EGZ16821.1 hypothetical protein PHYSODRAFT_346022 [Phytophthora sojae]|eukprot:XP_009525879.1 hypothetical protein PHYSODRAFT_346022 [Phytophthora sojae]
MSGQLSANARKQQEEDIERLVKCRLRSEIEARKAVESTMKRAVQEARELKKELVLLRQEKEELRAAAQKSAGSSGNESARNRSNDSQAGKQSSSKAAELKLKQQIQTLTARNKEIEAAMDELQQRVSEIESQNASITDQSAAALAKKDQEIATLQEALKKSKLAVDETKRKCQKLLKEKREEMERALQENEQLARNAKKLQGQLALLPQLKKKLEHAKENRADVAEVWQKKLEQRDQAFLREEEASKQKLAESVAQITKLVDEKLELREKVDELEHRLRNIVSKHKSELSQESRRMEALEASVIQLKEKLVAAAAAAQEAERAEVVTRETQEQETRLRQLAEDAADAVEIRAEKAERDLAQARMQLDRLEEALKARGVTLDYLLKQQTPVSIPSRTPPADRGANRPRVTSTLKRSGSTAPRDPARSKTMGKSRLSPEDTKNPSRMKAGRGSSSSSNNNNQEE